MTASSDFFVRFWGVRGSIPCPGPATVRYGGNTSCLEVRCGERLFVLDAGSGLRMLDRALGPGPLDADVLFTHTHLDHVNGWAFFTRLTDPRNRIEVWAGHLDGTHRITDVLGRFLEDPLAPVHAGNLAATVTYHEFRQGDSLTPRHGVKVRTAGLNHPNNATGYRIEYGGHAICYVTDTEHKDDVRDPAILGLIEKSDIFIYDATYTDQEYPKYAGWGHSSWQEGMRLADAAGVGTYVAFHHDPGHDDDAMDAIAALLGRARPGSVVAREGMVLRP